MRLSLTDKGIVTILLANLLLATLYFAASKFGFTLAVKAEQVTVVWPPTGIALAALLLFGCRLAPGIALGAFFANVTTHEPVFTALGISVGNTLEALSATYLLRNHGFENCIARLKDVLALIFCAAILNTMISATIGVISLCLGGVQPWSDFSNLWTTWWLGDATGALIFAPVLLVWGSCDLRHLHWHRLPEALILFACLVLVCISVFIEPSLLAANGRAFVYIIFPFVIWAALRFGQQGTSLLALAALFISIWATIRGNGPFNIAPLSGGLVQLQLFMATVSITGMFLSAATEERRTTEAALREADRRKDEFLATLAHELRNPLAPLSNALSILQKPGLDPTRAKEAIDIMQRQVRQMVRLVDDLLDVSRISHGKVELHLERIALQQVINSALETSRPLIEAAGHRLTVEMPEDPIWLKADLTRLSQVFSNLLSNAAKYTPPGGEISLQANVTGTMAEVWVRDNGIGIAPEMLPKVFDLFTQADSSMGRAQGGLGIGLTLVKNLVAMHGGTVEAYSAGLQKGSAFVIRLPISSSPQPSMTPPKAKSNAPSRRLKVLIVDDNQNLARTLGWMVEALGHEAQVAHSGEAALPLARSFKPDAALIDLGLPGMTGYDLCRCLRSDLSLTHCVIVAQTGWGQFEHRQRTKEAGFNFHLVKPMQMEALEEVLASVGH